MRTLIVYATKHSATSFCAGRLAEELDGEVSQCQLGQQKVPALEGFDQIVVGGSIHIGKIQKEVTQFITAQQEILMQKRLGLFICCMAAGEEANAEIKSSFPDALLAHATAQASFGGCFNFDKMNWLERKMIQMIQKKESGGQAVDVSRNIDKIDRVAISEFAAVMNQV
jgi:menaquinone-dependent protoporphyrinogen oxidase